ncbi:class I SAM-dependent methyltransferase [Halobacteria archaeon AArc-curdl1]|uniref:Class I SAM-dependent methyltransferase n=1 Tax=Natronosalvus hydrolyticus TaxID=2979988 RepID=A0AAP3E5K2_9EURY|nr:class I SAM-dependent methyltransferase [Halobacteria archaeon AArc-curdl1]
MSQRSPSLEVLLLLRAARETGALEALMRTAATPSELCERTDLTERGAESLIDVLEAEGFLQRVGDSYEPTNRSLGFLAKTDVRSIGSLPAILDRLDRGFELDETLCTDAPRPIDARERRNNLGAQAAVEEATVRAVVTEIVRTAPDATRVLEISGAPGRYAVELASRGLEVVLTDTPARLADSKAILAGKSVRPLEADTPADMPAERFDITVGIEYASCFAPAANSRLVERATERLKPGGWLVLVERLEGEGATRRAVELLLETDAGRVYDGDRYLEWFEEYGLEESAVSTIPGTGFHAIAGRWPLDG